MAAGPTPLPWWQLIVILIVIAIVVGIGIGLLGNALEVSTWWSGPVIGVIMGVVGALLLARRKQAQDAQKQD